MVRSPSLVRIGLLLLVVAAVTCTVYLGNPLGQPVRTQTWAATSEVGDVRVVSAEENRTLPEVATWADAHLKATAPLLGLPLRPLTVALFEDKDDYRTYGTAEIPGFHPRMDFCYSPAETAVVGYWTGRRELFATLRHEMFHHLSQGRAQRPPLWLEEGMAEICENLDLNQDGSLRITSLQADHLRMAGRAVQRGGVAAVTTFLANDRHYFRSEPLVAYGLGYSLALFLHERGRLMAAVLEGRATIDAEAFASFAVDSDRWSAVKDLPLMPVHVASVP